MALRIVPNPTFRTRVSLSVPGAAAAVVEIEWRHKGRTEFAAWWDSIDGKTDADVLASVIASWTDVLDEQGEQLTFSAEALTQLVDRFPASALELLGAYRKALFEAREKN